MALQTDIVITGMGVVSPIGIGLDAFGKSLCSGSSGVRKLEAYDREDMPVRIGAEVRDFEPKKLVRPRKSLKIMSHDIQLGVAAAVLAGEQAEIVEGAVDAERLGVVFGSDVIHLNAAELGAPVGASVNDAGQFDWSLWGQNAFKEFNPLWMLKYLPNMTACHVGIAHDARGPNNTITLGDVSTLVAMAEAVRVLERGCADVVFTGGSFSRVHTTFMIRSFNSQQSRRYDEPQAAMRPFDLNRDGFVNGEGAGVYVFETRQHAQARGAKILATVLGYGNAYEPAAAGQERSGQSIRGVIRQALEMGGLTREDVGHVNAHGLSTTLDDRLEASAIAAELGDVPVTAVKSYIGNLGSAGAAVELAASVLALENDCLPPTLNYQTPDPQCPINVVHGQSINNVGPTALKLSYKETGQAAALLIGRP